MFRGPSNPIQSTYSFEHFVYRRLKAPRSLHTYMKVSQNLSPKKCPKKRMKVDENIRSATCISDAIFSREFHHQLSYHEEGTNDLGIPSLLRIVLHAPVPTPEIGPTIIPGLAWIHLPCQTVVQGVFFFTGPPLKSSKHKQVTLG